MHSVNGLKAFGRIVTGRPYKNDSPLEEGRSLALLSLAKSIPFKVSICPRTSRLPSAICDIGHERFVKMAISAYFQAGKPL